MTRPRMYAHVRSLIDPEGAVLLDLKRGKYHSLNAVGAVIWTGLEQGLPLPELERTLATQFEITPETVAVDVAQFLRELKSKRLLDWDE